MDVTIVRPVAAGLDRYGDALIAGTTTHTVSGCFTAPRSAGGDVAGPGRAGVIVGLTLYAPFGSDIIYADRVEIADVTYEIDGEPGSWLHPSTGWRAGMEIALRRVNG